jgi:mannosyltransferase OCH1-like enzyme
MWLQGEDQMPAVSSMCLRSWIVMNPDYELRFLLEDNLNQFIDVSILNDLNPSISIQERSNVIRMLLLEQHGGVWADATTYCNAPLDTWLEDSMSGAGFFAFSFKQADRLMSNWFMAAEQNARIVQIFNRHYIEFWQRKSKIRVIDEGFKKRIRKLKLGRVFNKRPGLWNSFFMHKVFKRYHYFVFHYLFGQLVKRNKEFAKYWSLCNYRSAEDAHIIQRLGLNSEWSKEASEAMDHEEIKVHKLTWKIDLNQESESTIYAALQQKIEKHELAKR